MSNWIVGRLHRSALLRRLARRIFRGWTIRQPFHGGIVCIDAVEHSWAWTGAYRYETSDLELQDKLLALSRRNDMLLDIGCNVGVMLLSVALRNPSIRALGVDPNHRAIELLNRSISANKLAARVRVLESVVADRDGTVTFDEMGSVTGHVSEVGRTVACVNFASLLNEHSRTQKCLVKIDIEGFEAVALAQLPQLQFRGNVHLVIELHPKGFNGAGDPLHCARLLRESGANLLDLDDRPIDRIPESGIAQVQAVW